MYSQILKCKPFTCLVFEKAAQISRHPYFYCIFSRRLRIEKRSKIAFWSCYTKNDQARRNDKSVVNKETRKNTDFCFPSHSRWELKWWTLNISSLLWSFSDTINYRLDALFRLREVDLIRIYHFLLHGTRITGYISDPIKTEARFSKDKTIMRFLVQNRISICQQAISKMSIKHGRSDSCFYPF